METKEREIEGEERGKGRQAQYVLFSHHLLDGNKLSSNVPPFSCLHSRYTCKSLRSVERMNVSIAWMKSTMHPKCLLLRN